MRHSASISRLNPSLLVSDSGGRELARSNSQVGSDPLLDFTAPADGRYLLTLVDFLYGGGNDYFYRLTVHQDPHIDFVFPPAGMPNSTATFTVYGRNLPGGKPSDTVVGGTTLEALTVQLPLPASARAEAQPATCFVAPSSSLLDWTEYRCGASALARIYLADATVVSETEPNDEPSTAVQVTVPCEVAGQFYPARDVDWVEFAAKKGETYWIDLLSHRLGLFTDPRMLVQRVTVNADGAEVVKDLANVDDSRSRNSRIGSNFDFSTDDPSYRLTADQDATYRIMIRDQFGDSRNDPRMVYRLIIRKPQPDFRLVAVPVPVQTPVDVNKVRVGAPGLRKGGTNMVSVSIDRRDGFQGTVDLSVEGLPPGVTTRGAVLGPQDSSTSLILHASPDASPWAGTVRVVGRTTSGDEQLVRYARAGTVVWGTANRRIDAPKFRSASGIALAVMDDSSPADVQLGDQSEWETARGGKVEIPIKITRGRGFNGALKLVCTGLPRELKPGDVTVKAGASEAKLVVNVSKLQDEGGSVFLLFASRYQGQAGADPRSGRSGSARTGPAGRGCGGVEQGRRSRSTTGCRGFGRWKGRGGKSSGQPVHSAETGPTGEGRRG